jgi:hypothetical protein
MAGADSRSSSRPTSLSLALSALSALATAAAAATASAPPRLGNLTYLTYYTIGPMNSTDPWGRPYTLPGPQGTEPGSNVAIGFDTGPGSFGTGASSLPHIRAIWEARHVPTFYTPDGWFACKNASRATGGLLPGWRDSLQQQAAALRPLVAAGAVRGIFYGDELGVCGVPFWAVDAGISYFRAALGERDGLVHHTNACEMTLGCPPPPGPVCDICEPGCGNEWQSRYWPHIPAALDFVSVDVYCHYDGGRCASAACPGGPSEVCEVASARRYYEAFVFPKLSPHQRVWLVPGLFAAIKPAPSYAQSLASSVNDTAQLAKLRGYAAWTAAEPRIVGWMPYHLSSRLWDPTPASGSWGAEVMPEALAFLAAHAPPKL